MASTPDGSSPPEDKRGRRKRPAPPTIDLTATEVASEPAPDAPAPEAPAPQAPGETPTAAARESEPAAEATPSPPPAAAEPSATPRPEGDDALKAEAAAEPADGAPAAAEAAAAEAAAEGAAAEAAAEGAAAEAAAAEAAGPTEQSESERRGEPVEPSPPSADLVPPVESDAPEPDRRRPSAWPLWTAIAAALVLAVVSILLASARRDDAGQRVAGLESELARLRQRVDNQPAPAVAPPSAAAPADAAQRAAVADLVTRLKAVEDSVQRLNGVPARLDAAEQAAKEAARQAATQAAAQATKQADDAHGATAALDDLRSRLDKLEQAPPAPPPAANDSGLGDRLAAADAAAKSLTDRVAAAESAVSALAARVSTGTANEAAVNERLAAIDAQLRALNERVAGLGKRADEVADAARAAERQGAIATAQATHARAESDREVRLALVATALRDAVLRGDPYASEFAAIKPLAPDPARLAALDAFATTGVPSAATLANELKGLVPAMASRAPGPAREGGLIGRLQASAEKLVRIRRIDEPAPDDASSTVSRIEADAGRQDIDAALADLAKLPPDMRALAEPWIKRAEARRAALAAADGLARDAAASLSRK